MRVLRVNISAMLASASAQVLRLLINFLHLIRGRITMKRFVVVFCLCILCSTEIVAAEERILRQASPQLTNNCSEQQENDFRSTFIQECKDAYDQALNFTNVASILSPNPLPNPSHYVKLCSEPCLPTVLEHLRACYGEEQEGLAVAIEGACHFNKKGTMCYTALYNSFLKMPNWLETVMPECFVNFTLYDSDLKLTKKCSDSCRRGLHQVRSELGCCLNSIYNNSFVGEHLPFANYSLWSNCGLESESPGYCASAGVRPAFGAYAVFAATMTVVLALL